MGTVAVDLRLTPRATAAAVDASGGVLQAPATAALPFGVTVTIPAGSRRCASTTATLTRLSPQGLPGLLPLGWSPLAAFELAAAITDRRLAARRHRRDPAPAARRTSPATTRRLHAWTLVAAGLVPVSDSLRRQPRRPGQLRPGRPGRLGSAARWCRRPATCSRAWPWSSCPRPLRAGAASSRRVIPPTGGTAEGALTVTSPAPLPSGTVVSADITETYTLATGVVASEEKRLVDIVLYRRGHCGRAPGAGTTPAGSVELSARFPITPARTFEAVDLTTGTVHLDILAGREGVRGSTGGSEAIQLRSGDAALAIPALALTAPTPIDFRQVDLDDSLPTGPGLTPIAEVSLDLSGRDPRARRAAHAFGCGHRVDRRAGRAPVRADRPLRRRAEARGRWPWPSFRPTASCREPRPACPGIVREGRYVLYRSTIPFGFVSGSTTASPAGTPVRRAGAGDGRGPAVRGPRRTPRATTSRWPCPAPSTWRPSVPGTSLAGTGTTVVVAGQTAALDLRAGRYPDHRHGRAARRVRGSRAHGAVRRHGHEPASIRQRDHGAR